MLNDIFGVVYQTMTAHARWEIIDTQQSKRDIQIILQKINANYIRHFQTIGTIICDIKYQIFSVGSVPSEPWSLPLPSVTSPLATIDNPVCVKLITNIEECSAYHNIIQCITVRPYKWEQLNSIPACQKKPQNQNTQHKKDDS